jgi:hypothetical protein
MQKKNWTGILLRISTILLGVHLLTCALVLNTGVTVPGENTQLLLYISFAIVSLVIGMLVNCIISVVFYNEYRTLKDKLNTIETQLNDRKENK